MPARRVAERSHRACRRRGIHRPQPQWPTRWSRRGRVLTADPGREFAFATEEGGREGCLWRYRFTETDVGTTTTEESFEIVWLPRWIRIADVITLRRGQVHRGMRRTLERLKAAAEAT